MVLDKDLYYSDSLFNKLSIFPNVYRGKIETVNKALIFNIWSILKLLLLGN